MVIFNSEFGIMWIHFGSEVTILEFCENCSLILSHERDHMERATLKLQYAASDFIFIKNLCIYSAKP
jgi:hypothetical protein